MTDVEETLKSPQYNDAKDNISAAQQVSVADTDDMSSGSEPASEPETLDDSAQESPATANEVSSDTEESTPDTQNELSDSEQTVQETQENVQENIETAQEGGEPEQKTVQDNTEKTEQQDQPKPQKKSFFKTSTRLIFSRITYYLFLSIFIFNVPYPDFLRLYGSILLVGYCFYSNKFLTKINRFNPIIQDYLTFTTAVFDMGVTIFLMYLSGSSRNLFMLSFPVLTWVYGFYGFNVSVIGIFLLNTLLFYITGITFGRSDISTLNIELGFYSQLFVLTWIITIHAFSKWFRSQSDLRYEIVKMIEKLFSKLPKSVFEQIASLMNAEEIMGLKHKFKQAIEHLQLQIIERDQEIEYLKQNGVEGGGTMQDNFAVNEINSLLDIENLSLKENNKKLMELNKSLEQRVQMLVQELEIANSELERVYSSINDPETEPVEE